MSGLLPALGGGAGNVIPLAAGGLSGVLAMSALIATSVVAVHPNPPVPANLVVSSCMGDGPALGVAKPGDKLWVTGKSADGTYLQVHVPGPIGQGWVLAEHVTLLATDAIPVAACVQVAQATGTPGPTAVPATATPTAGPTATTKPTATPTPKPTAGPTVAAPTQPPPPTARPTARPAPTPNVGPLFTTQPASSSTTMGWNPLQAPNCPYPVTIRISAAAADADGVAAMQLWLLKPGARSFVRPGHDFAQSGSLWLASISTARDGVAAEGALSYYAVAIDSKGAQTTSTTRTLEVFRCDMEATISGGINLRTNINTGYYALSNCYPFSIPFWYSLSDRDGLVGATLTYTITNATKTATLGPRTLDLVRYKILINPWRVSTIAPRSGAAFLGYNTVRFWVTTTDKYGGTTSTSRRVTKIVDYYNCVD